MLKASGETLPAGHVCSKEPVTESSAQQANRLTLSRPRDFTSAFAKGRDFNAGCGASEGDGTLPVPLENVFSSDKRNGALHQNRSLFLDKQELGGEDG